MKLRGIKLVFAVLFLFLFSESFTLSITKAESNSKNQAVSDSLFFWKGNVLGEVELVTKNKNFGEPVYSLEEGVLIYTSAEQAYLRTKEDFSNYEFHAEWRWLTEDEKGNSGILIHIAKPDSVWPKCMQIQLKKDNAGDLLAMSGAESEQTIGKPKETEAKFSPSNEKPGIEWNSCDIICNGDSVRVFVNGLLQNVGTKMNIHIGGVALQLEGRPIMFRNVYLIKK